MCSTNETWTKIISTTSNPFAMFTDEVAGGETGCNGEVLMLEKFKHIAPE